MNRYNVILARTYRVTLRAESKEEAKSITEYFLGDCTDQSNEKHRKEENFFIEEIELVQNDALEADRIRD